MMPWEKYQTQTETGPWSKYAQPSNQQPADAAPTQQPQSNTSQFQSVLLKELADEKARWSQPPVNLRRMLEYGGMTVGGVVGTSGGPLGNVAGAGLGYSIGKKTADIIYGKPSGTVGQEIVGSAKDVATGSAMEIGGQIVGKFIEMVGKYTAEKLVPMVRKNIERAIRPSVAGQKTAGMAEQYFDRATDAVSNIIANKNNLILTDETGKTISGLPKTLKQFSEAIQQTKQAIFKEYDALAKQAEQMRTARPLEYPMRPGESVKTEGMGAGGKAYFDTGPALKIDLNPIANELTTALGSKPFQDMAPDAATYAAKRVETLTSRGSYTPSEAQEAIQILNNSLESFYQNPSYETASKAYIDSMIANNLRRELDVGIETLTGEQYQQLKNTYGALSTIERDVARRSAVDARKNIKGLIDFSDIFSGGEVVRGILARDPSMIGMGVTAKGIASWYRWINNPNRIVKNMFRGVEDLISKSYEPKVTAGKELAAKTGIYIMVNGKKKYIKVK
jgi:hypothetical protein